MTTDDKLVEFLLARLDEREAAAEGGDPCDESSAFGPFRTVWVQP